MIWSRTSSPTCVGFSAKRFSTSALGHPWRVGFGKSSAKCFLPSSRKALSTDGFRLWPFDLRLADGKGEALLNPFASVF